MITQLCPSPMHQEPGFMLTLSGVTNTPLFTSVETHHQSLHLSRAGRAYALQAPTDSCSFFEHQVTAARAWQGLTLTQHRVNIYATLEPIILPLTQLLHKANRRTTLSHWRHSSHVQPQLHSSTNKAKPEAWIWHMWTYVSSQFIYYTVIRLVDCHQTQCVRQLFWS